MRQLTVSPTFEPLAGRLARGPLAKTLPRFPTAALRVPDAKHTPLPFVFPKTHPQIFVHEGVRQRLERRLAAAFPGPVQLAITDNRHDMVSFARREGVLRARVHMMFLDAPTRVQRALVQYIAEGDRDASLVVGRYIDVHGYRIRATRPVQMTLVTRGRYHDLLSLAQRVNGAYFGGAADVLVTWGRAPRRETPRTTIKLGSYSAVERLVRLHPSLDRTWVPRYFVEFVLFHEMLHHLMPQSRGAGRHMLHPPEFRAREAEFRHYARAVAWERAHLARLLRS